MGLLTEKLKAKFEQFPLGSQEGKGFDAECIAKFFVAAATWFITEASKEEDDYILFGYADLGFGPECSEWGYMSLNELEEVRTPMGFKVEQDRYAEGKTVRELCEEIGLEYNDFFSSRNDYGIEEDEI